MRLLIMSDLHLECHADRGSSFIESLDETDVDCLVLAGDTCAADDLHRVMSSFCAKFKHVIAIAGNHEYYNCSYSSVIDNIEKSRATIKNLSFLDTNVIEFDGHRIIGGTMWFPNPGDYAPFSYMNDFQLIDSFTDWVYFENERFVRMLDKELCNNDIVITHHLPSKKSIAPEFSCSALNCFFLSDSEDLIIDRKPKLWIHGHTHKAFDYRFGKTRIVCNPFGYPREPKSDFSSQKIVIV